MPDDPKAGKPGAAAAAPKNSPAPAGKSARIDFGSIAGLAVALLGILGGLTLEGGKLRDVAQVTAAMIVLGGTTGAVLVSMPLAVVGGALKRFAGVFREEVEPLGAVIEEVIGYATKARKNGLVSLEQEADKIADPFLRKALNLAIDGTDLQEIREMLELEIELECEQAEAQAKVFEAAGGYAPTIGIIGAVLGLIQVMKNLANIEEVGHGIAVAFVATVYGVGSANLLFLPAAAKIKARIAAGRQRKDLIVEAVAGIVEGLNPKLIRLKLEAYAQAGAEKPKQKAAKEKKAPQSAPAAEPAKGKA
jgi:chemotaxis protein MotA